jgi:hypothetical protein
MYPKYQVGDRVTCRGFYFKFKVRYVFQIPETITWKYFITTLMKMNYHKTD